MNINQKLFPNYETYKESTTSKHYKLAMDKLLINKWYEVLSLQNELDLLPQLKVVNKCIKTLKELKASNNNTCWLWLTINPKPKTDLTKFTHLLDKFANRKMFVEYKYVIEQRGVDRLTMGKGLHAHLLLKRNLKYKPSIIFKNSQNTFKNITNVKNKEIFYFKWCPQDFLADKINYMTEDKGGEKTQKQKIDLLYRSENSLCNIYESG